ncbi:hypothetical protein [Paraburkholderia xenovorans]|jgi:hypothetical protein|uniref:hypothetical protein n=1 Tax=Paraburkholderia xenovorans TaxID=36873 RepID=UPI00058A05CB|nr:hypothetical protein [Paraburkholderia xenovorans]NPT35553.1 hypothetical protein [Paraburkholderia xenovorans]
MSLVSTIYVVQPANVAKEVPSGYAALYASHLMVMTRKAVLPGISDICVFNPLLLNPAGLNLRFSGKYFIPIN